MANYNIEMSYYNGNGCDTLYPKTLLNNVKDWEDSIYSKSEVNNIQSSLSGSISSLSSRISSLSSQITSLNGAIDDIEASISNIGGISLLASTTLVNNDTNLQLPKTLNSYTFLFLWAINNSSNKAILYTFDSFTEGAPVIHVESKSGKGMLMFTNSSYVTSIGENSVNSAILLSHSQGQQRSLYVKTYQTTLTVQLFGM